MTAAGDWLQTKPWTEVGLTLLVEGLDLGFTTSDDAAGLSAAWAAVSDWGDIRSGLQVSGTTGGEVSLFDAQIRPVSLSFTITTEDDSLGATLLAAARKSAGRVDLATSIDAAATSVQGTTSLAALFPGGIGSTGLLHLGNEAVQGTCVGDVASGLTRGVRSLAGTFTDPSHFAKRFVIDTVTGDRPTISDQPLSWFHRGVSLYACHRVNGIWSAGLPGTTSNDSELVWSGRISSWSDDAVGRITLGCEDITGRLQTTLLTKQYAGSIADGIFVNEFDTEIGTAIETFNTSDGTTIAYPAGFNVAWSSWAGSGRMSVEQIVNAITVVLADRFVTHAGTYGPSTFRVALVELADGKVHVLFQALPGTLPGFQASLGLYLAPRVWSLLGWGDDNLGDTQRTNTAIDSVVRPAFIRSQDLTLENQGTLDVAPANLPTRTRLVDGDEFEVIPSDSQQSFTAFYPQPNIGELGVDSDAQGFMMVGSDRVFAVKQTGTNAFALAGEVSAFFTAANSNAQDPASILDAKNVSSIAVKQVWCELGSMGSIFLRLMASTGTPGYNHPDHDVYPPWMSVGVPWTLLDSLSILQLSQSRYCLLLTKPIAFTKLLESALNFAGAQLVLVGGKLKIISIPRGSVINSDLLFTEDNKAKQVSGSRGQVQERTVTALSTQGLINRLTLKYNQLLGGEFNRTITVNATRSQKEQEQARGPVLEALGIYDVRNGLVDGGGKIDSGLDTWTKYVTSTALAYFSEPTGTLDRSFDFSLASKMFAGARVAVNDSAIIDPTSGNRGVVGLLCWVLSWSFDWSTGVGKVTCVYQPGRASERFRAWAPSGRVLSYDAPTKTLTLVLHQYSLSTEDSDAASFEVGDAVRVVELSPQGEPLTWIDTVSSVDAGASTVRLTTGLSGFDPAKTFVLEYADTSLATQTQKSFHAFLNGQSSWDGVPDPVDAPYVTTARYRRPNFTATDSTSPASVHKMGELSDWVNTALVHHTAPVYVNQLFAPAPVDVATTQFQTVCGPLFIPLYFASNRRLIMRALIRHELGSGCTLRFVSSVSRPAGPAIQGFFDPTYVDVAAGGTNWGTVSRFQVVDYEWVEAIISPRVTTKDGVPGCYVTVDVANSDSKMTTHVYGWYVAEEHSA